MKKLITLCIALTFLFILKAQDDLLSPSIVSGLKFRNVGPALTSGRIADIAVHPTKKQIWYVAVASGGVWKTTNAGTTFKPIFDSQGSYSIGCVTIDQNNPNVIWIGTGENNNQRSVAFGDGVYRSEDGGKSWKNVGLKESEHIGMISIDPSNSNRVFVAAYGPLWSKGGDRGLYLTEDAGKTWEKVIDVSENTGFNEVHIDQNNPDIIYAAAHQRRRHVFTYISGGPESAIYKSQDGGKKFDKLENGIPKGDKGRIALDISPVNSNVVYAMIEGNKGTGGFYKSTDKGASWNKTDDYNTSGNYYVEIIADPKNVDKLFSMDTWCHATVDGGKTFEKINEKNKHVDNHCIWIDPADTDHYIMGCDGGLYETWDNATSWHFKPNLPVTQFYRVSVDYAEPFYNIYGGTQDNFSMGGPSANNTGNGIPNSDWFITNGGDGFETCIDPTDPNIVYAQSQYGWLVRYEKSSGETIDIKPVEIKEENGYRWNWDAPLIISPHNNKRLYFAANKVFKSDDRGNSWQVISDDLSQQLDRNKLQVMDRVWSVDAVAKNKSTTIYGNIVFLDESPVKEGLLYAGTDDGLIHVTEDGGITWRKISSFSGIPAYTYVNFVKADLYDENIVYAGFNNHKNGDFKPYVLKSSDKGATWKAMSGDLPERGSVFTFAQDHVNNNLMFVGTEFGVFFTVDAGTKWVQLKSGLPTIAVRDLELQRKANDLVLASFGRGFYVLDDYTPLRNLSEDTLKEEAYLFKTKTAKAFIQSAPIGQSGNSFQGDGYYAAKNPAYGATFNFYLKESLKTARETRIEIEKEQIKNKEAIAYPTFDQLRAEDNEEKPYLIFTITDDNGAIVKRILAKASKGIQRVVWNLRYPSKGPLSSKVDLYEDKSEGAMVVPGTYFVQVSKRENGKITDLTSKKSFEVESLELNKLKSEDKTALLTFSKKIADLQRAAFGTSRATSDLKKRAEMLKKAVLVTPNADLNLLNEIDEILSDLKLVDIKLNGDKSIKKREFETAPSITDRVGQIVWYVYNSTSAPTQTQRDSYRVAGEAFKALLADLNATSVNIDSVHDKLEQSKAPYVPGKIPNWGF